MDDDNIIPYETSPTLTVKQAVMHMLGYRGEYNFTADTEPMEFDLYEYSYDLQEVPDCDFVNASSELVRLKRNDSPSAESIKNAEKMSNPRKLNSRKQINFRKSPNSIAYLSTTKSPRYDWVNAARS